MGAPDLARNYWNLLERGEGEKSGRGELPGGQVTPDSLLSVWRWIGVGPSKHALDSRCGTNPCAVEIHTASPIDRAELPLSLENLVCPARTKNARLRDAIV